MEYSTRPKYTRDRSQKLNRSQDFNFQKQHRPQQDMNTSSRYWILDNFHTSCAATKITAPQPPTVIVKVQQQRSASVSLQPTSFIVVDDQQPEPSRQLMFALSPTKSFNPPSITSRQQEDSQHNTSGLSSLFGSMYRMLVCR